MMLSFKYRKICFWAVFSLVVGCFAFILLAFPKSYDDWWFWGETLHYGSDAGGHHSLWMGIRESFWYHWGCDNVRLCNIVAASLLYVPKWIPAFISAFCFGLGFWLMAKVAGVRIGDVAKLVLLSLFVVFPIAWQEAMFSQIYAYNYICSIPLLFGCIYLFIKDDSPNVVWMVVLGLILGAWQEAYAFTMLGGGIAVLLIHRKMLNSKRIIMLVAVAVGLLWILLPPALWVRFGHSDYSGFKYARLVYLVVVFGSALLTAIFLCIGKYRTMALSPLPVFTCVSAVGLTILVLYTGLIRAAMPAMLLGACCMVFYSDHLWPRTFKDASLASWAISFFGTMALALHLVAVCDETVRIRRVIDKANLAYILNHKSKAVFSEMRYPWEASPLTLGRPDINIYRPYNYHFQFLNYFNRNHDLMIVPESLRNYMLGDGKRLPGGTDCRLWNGYIVSPNLSDTTRRWIEVQYGRVKTKSPIETVVFSNVSHDDFVYIVPDRPVHAMYAGEPSWLSFDVSF